MKNLHPAAHESPCPVVFVTGATGFLGGALLARLVDRSEVRLIALARSKNGLTPSQRVLLSINRFLPEAIQALPEHVQVVDGDLHSLDGVLNDLHGTAVTHVLHAAANTSFRSKRGVWEINYEGTKRLLSFCGRMENLRRLLYVGTAMACGERGEGIAREETALDPQATHIVEYTRSKAATEMELLARSTLPIVVVRPSIIVGHTIFGVKPSASIWWFFRAVATLRFHTWGPMVPIDVVPVDWVAEALHVLLLKKQLEWSVYHLSAGVAGSPRWADIDRAFVGRSNTAPRAGTTSELSVIHPEAFTLFPSVEKARLTEALFAYYRFASLGVVFDNQRVRSEGVAAPPLFTSLVGRYLQTGGARSIEEQMRDDD